MRTNRNGSYLPVLDVSLDGTIYDSTKKEVGTGDSQARIFIGTLQEAQWNEYKKTKASSLPSWTSRTCKKPAFNNTKVEGRIECLTWDANVQSMPVLANLERCT
jgi:hypothetical protein